MSDQDYNDVKFFPPGIYFAIASALSSVTSSLVSILCLRTGLYKDALGFMIFAINFSDAIFFTVKLFASIFQPQSEGSCDLALSIGYYGLISSVFWSALFGHALYTVSRKQSPYTLPKYTLIYKIVALGLPLALTFLQVPTNLIIYSPEAGACVHRFYQNKADITYISFMYLPIGGSLLMSIVWYVMAAFKFKKMVNRANSTEMFTLLIYPAILLLCWGPIFIKNFLVVLDIKLSDGLSFAIQITSLLQGFFDALVYGVSKKRYKQICSFLICKKGLPRRRASTETIRHSVTPQYLERHYIKMQDNAIRTSIGVY